MEHSTQFPVLLFSYGTLQDKAVQLANFGRELVGQHDDMLGYAQSWVEITDPQVLATSGKTHHPIIAPTEEKSASVEGMVFQINEQELAAADAYEAVSYTHLTLPTSDLV